MILLGRLHDASVLPVEPMLTAITLAELSVGPLVATDDAERAARQAHLQRAEADFVPLPFDARAAGQACGHGIEAGDKIEWIATGDEIRGALASLRTKQPVVAGHDIAAYAEVHELGVPTRKLRA